MVVLVFDKADSWLGVSVFGLGAVYQIWKELEGELYLNTMRIKQLSRDCICAKTQPKQMKGVHYAYPYRYHVALCSAVLDLTFC